MSENNVEILAKLPVADLLETRARAAARGQLDFANEVNAAIAMRDAAAARGPTSGKLVEHIQSETINGVPTGRHFATYEGDCLCWMKHYMSPGVTGHFARGAKLDELRFGKLKSAHVPDGYRLAVVGMQSGAEISSSDRAAE